MSITHNLIHSFEYFYKLKLIENYRKIVGSILNYPR